MLEAKDMRIACSSLAFSRQSLEESLQRIAALGFRYVDVGIQENRAHINPSDIERDVAGVKERLDRACQTYFLGSSATISIAFLKFLYKARHGIVTSLRPQSYGI